MNRHSKLSITLNSRKVILEEKPKQGEYYDLQ